MNVIGFNFTKIHASRKTKFPKMFSVNTDIEFVEMQKETLNLLKDSHPIRTDFKYTINYTQGEGKKQEQMATVEFTGNILLTVKEEESKEILKNWKKKKVSPSLKMALFNLILKKCTVKALALEEEIGIPSHHPHAVPQIRAQKKD